MGNDSSKNLQGKKAAIKNLNPLSKASTSSSSHHIRSHLENASKSRVLQIKALGLKEIPPSIEEVCEILRTLDASSNKILHIPSLIAKFTNLKQLNVSNNRLVGLPPEIGFLNVLEVINLENNQIAELPNELASCVFLKNMNLSSNKFNHFPSVILKLKRIEIVNLSNNQITLLPDEISSLQAVELDLSKNQLSELNSNNLAKCQKLRVLRLDENCLQKAAFTRELLEQSSISLITCSGNLFLEKDFQSLPGYDAYEKRFTATKRKIM